MPKVTFELHRDVVYRTDYRISNIPDKYLFSDYFIVTCVSSRSLSHWKVLIQSYFYDSYSTDEGSFQTKLRKVDLSLVSNDDCQLQLRTTRLGQFFNLDKSFICAGGQKGMDTCQVRDGKILSKCAICQRRKPSYRISQLFPRN